VQSFVECPIAEKSIVNTEAEVTEFKILAVQRPIAAACSQQTHALRFSSDSACETLVFRLIAQSSQFTVN